MKNRTVSVAFIVVMLLGVSVVAAQGLSPQAAIRYAAPTAQGSGDCSSWGNACTLQTALTGAVSGDEIWVKAGTYTPGSARTDSFRIERNNVQLYGGFAGTETARNQRDWVAHPTILSGDIGTVGNNSDNAYHVVYVNGVTYENITSATVIDGFTITAGNANGSSPDNSGGGLYCNGAGSGHACSPTLTNVTFSSNTATYYGGGMYNDGLNGGTSSPTLTNVTFSGNTATYYGGGMYNDGLNGGTSSPTLTNVTFSGNSARWGGGMLNYGSGGTSSPTLTNVTFSGNTATYYGGGMLNYGSGGNGRPTLSNCILWGNTAPNGPQMYNSSASPIVSCSDIQGGCPSGATCGAGMLYTDPKFVNAAGGNLRLDFGSPAIDAGSNAAVPGGVTTDLDGLPRFADGNDDTFATVDMGAYEAGTMVCGVSAST
ncbi:MAG TPA: choice-of-anchor Q domain-containing protein, partial [Anaerolineae bacterium]|nr:choice-of-anchor Q domain-containing protein [Anaerolineae bacterium]